MRQGSAHSVSLQPQHSAQPHHSTGAEPKVLVVAPPPPLPGPAGLFGARQPAVWGMPGRCGGSARLALRDVRCTCVCSFRLLAVLSQGLHEQCAARASSQSWARGELGKPEVHRRGDDHWRRSTRGTYSVTVALLAPRGCPTSAPHPVVTRLYPCLGLKPKVLDPSEVSSLMPPPAVLSDELALLSLCLCCLMRHGSSKARSSERGTTTTCTGPAT